MTSPDPQDVDHLGFVPLTVALSVEPLETSTVYVRGTAVSTVLVPPRQTQLEEEAGVPSPGALITLVGEREGFSVLETPREVFELLARSEASRK